MHDLGTSLSDRDHSTDWPGGWLGFGAGLGAGGKNKNILKTVPVYQQRSYFLILLLRRQLQNNKPGPIFCHCQGHFFN